MKKNICAMLIAVVAAIAILPVHAELSVEVTKFHQSHPYSGKATVEYTVAGTLPADAVAQIVINTDDAGAIFVQSNIVAGANSNVIDFASSFGGALLLTNASFAVMIPAENRGGVQLWANGPCWAECNVGAATPEEYGYYFWWGDTVGYTNTGSGWVSVKDGTSISFSDSGTAASTYGKDNAALLSAGYIDSTGNLVAAHDAATAHLGAPWSMPTDAEFSALLSNCTTMWITTNGVNGRLVTGKGAYADRSIFLPAAGYGYDSCFDEPGSFGYYWSSTPISDIPDRAWSLNFDSGGIYSYFYDRCYGRAVRPVREFALCGADGTVTYDPPLCTIEVTRFHQSYPYSGKATVEYTVAGTLPADAVARIVISTDDASATFVQRNIVAGANTNEIDFASSFGGALLLTNALFEVTLTTEELGGGVQLWADDGIVTYDPSETQTTPVPVAKEWIDNYPALLAEQSGDYEAAANATAANGRKVWACYVAGLNPSDPLDDFRITRFWMDGYMPMFEFNHTTDGSGNSILPYIKPLGKARLEDGWRHVPDGGDPAFRFFAAEVVPPGCESIVVELGGVQLWENGPYWAECNVGAATPEESGYYFWWGDTVGYRRENDAWVATDGSTSVFLFNSDNTPTSDKDDAALLAAGWIDSTGNLAAAHDAATAHRGSPWRMPTDAEFSALISNCTTKWITTNGVSGRLVTGKGAYADKSIFLPATGYGDSSSLRNTSYGCWSSTPYDSDKDKAWRLFLSSVSIGAFGFGRSNGNRYEGRTVRPVRNPTD